jgi:hypothetical protein
MSWIKSPYFKSVALAVAFSILFIGLIPAQSMAYVMGVDTASSTVERGMDRAADMATAQRVLESKLVGKRLVQAGLTTDEVQGRLNALSDAELHQFAGTLDALYPGGGVGVIVSILVIVVLVLVILKITDHKIIIK